MPDNASSYRAMVEEPWGRMLYDLAWGQLALPAPAGLRMLDFGSGFGISAAHYAGAHRVTAIEPTADMLARRASGPPYEQIVGGPEALDAWEAGTFDVALCHNVLEYVADPAPIVRALCRVVKPGGLLSIIKHHLPGKVLHNAVFTTDLDKALSLMQGQRALQDGMFGTQRVYEQADLLAWAGKGGFSLMHTYGIRMFFGLSQLQEVKSDPAWYQRMLALERAAQEQEPYRSIAYFHHVVLRKEG